MKKQINPSIKAHLLWSALILLALVAVCAIPFTLAQSRSRGTSKQSVAKTNAPAITNLPPLTKSISARPAKPNFVLNPGAGRPLAAPAADGVVRAPTLSRGAIGANPLIPSGVLCPFHVLIVYADTTAPTQLQTEIMAEPNVVAVDLFDAQAGHSHSGTASAIRDRCAVQQFPVPGRGYAG